MSTTEIITLRVDQPVSRLDHFLAQAIPDLSRSQLQKIIRQGRVWFQGQPARASISLSPGDIVTLQLPPPVTDRPAQPEPLPLSLIYEDDALLVINKPAGLVVHPAPGHERGTLVNALLARYPDLATLQSTDPDRPGIVHRLDQDTSGLLVVARTASAQQHLQQQFKNRTVQKTYLALVVGHPPTPTGLIDIPLGRDPRHRQRIAPRVDGKPAQTQYRVQQQFTGYSLLEVDLLTGRTHQIRVHLAWLKCPVVGDTVYGRAKNRVGLSRQFLHAWQLAFHHPHTNARLRFEAPLDDELQAVLNRLD